MTLLLDYSGTESLRSQVLKVVNVDVVWARGKGGLGLVDSLNGFFHGDGDL